MTAADLAAYARLFTRRGRGVTLCFRHLGSEHQCKSSAAGSPFCARRVEAFAHDRNSNTMGDTGSRRDWGGAGQISEALSQDHGGSSLSINGVFFAFSPRHCRSGLENRCTGNRTVGSNPTLSAMPY